MERLEMKPGTGERWLRFVGDRAPFSLRLAGGQPPPKGWRAYLRANLGRADVLRHQIIHAHTGRLKLVDASWRDIPMRPNAEGWSLELPLTEAGFFRAKAYAVDERGWQHWPDGPDFGMSIHPDHYRTANTIYCAFTRMFGASRAARDTRDKKLEKELAALDQRGFTVIPPSGKLRDLARQLPHIIGALGCRVLHLLPIHPTPTVLARFGRFGSPYAAQDMTAIDPALVEFDQRTTGVDQFRELTYATHCQGARVFLDIVINHTGWGARLQEEHPEWYLRAPDGSFASPGAWGVTWEDLAELDQSHPALWEKIADILLTWCRRGVDGFRCDAGYKIPLPAWQYITARVLDEFPATVFLLEGLGGSWEATQNLLTYGSMQWAYSELFQNYSGKEVAGYLDYALQQSEQVGLYIHYSETHDNDRLAAKGRAWSRLRNQLCALTSVSGGYGFTCGVEWLADEKLLVHQGCGLAWDNPDNLVSELAALNRLLAEHPCFFDGAHLRRLSPVDSPVYALSRTSAEGLDRILVLVNTEVETQHPIELDRLAFQELGQPWFDLLSQRQIKPLAATPDKIGFKLNPGECLCLAAGPEPQGLSGEAYRRARAQAAWALTAMGQVMPSEAIGSFDWRELAQRVEANPRKFLSELGNSLGVGKSNAHYAKVVVWRRLDAKRITLAPPEHWLLIEDEVPFRAHLTNGERTLHLESIAAGSLHIACFAPTQPTGDAELTLERYNGDERHLTATIRFLAAEPDLGHLTVVRDFETDAPTMAREPGVVLLTNGIGGMAHLQVDLGRAKSKYDCLLGANLHPRVPVDRHILVKRVRVWVVADGFIAPLNGESLIRFTPGPPAEWVFVAGAGDGRAVEIRLTADMLPESNTTVLRFCRASHPPSFGEDLPEDRLVSLTVRVDLLDRNFHRETQRNGSADHHFASHCRPLENEIGFEFSPASGRQLRVGCSQGQYHHQAEWCEGVEHPVEATRGQVAAEDTYSPGWFELPMRRGDSAVLTLSAETDLPARNGSLEFEADRRAQNEQAIEQAQLPSDDVFGRQLALAVQSYVVRRDHGKTVIAGYPWFLDWGRDSLIAARGLLAAGLKREVRELIQVFGRFEQNGTLPNTILGEDASNRDTSDAPLWFGIVCEDLAGLEPDESSRNAFYASTVDSKGRTLLEVLQSMATNYIRGTPNGIRMDRDSGLVFSPTHFTWMDTNHPAGTPRQGYPVEVQVLWIRLLKQLARLRLPAKGEGWSELAERALVSFQQRFWLETQGYLADVLLSASGQPASQATVDTALRSNCLLAISLGLVKGEPARRCVEAAAQYLVVPGALRSLAPLPVSPPLAICGADGRLLNDPDQPYQGRYEGDEDTSRKPAYHNGTAWTWTFPTFCEALALAWDQAPSAISAAKAYLGSMDRLVVEGCRGHLPEIVDGDPPHTQRGCDAQAWGATEALRVWKWLHQS